MSSRRLIQALVLSAALSAGGAVWAQTPSAGSSEEPTRARPQGRGSAKKRTGRTTQTKSGAVMVEPLSSKVEPATTAAVTTASANVPSAQPVALAQTSQAAPASASTGEASATSAASGPQVVAPAAPAAVSKKRVLDPVTGAPVADLKKKWAINVGAEFRSLVVSDVDPANDRALSYFALAEFYPFPRARLFLRGGFEQRFVVEQGESPFFLQDTAAGGSYRHSIELSPVKSLDFLHTALVWLPTSRSSRAQELRAAPDVRSMVSMDIFHGLTPGLEARGQYRFHRYAERAGPGGGMLPQLVLTGRAFARFPIWRFERFGVIDVGADVVTSWVKRYSSAETYVDPTGASEAAPWNQRFGWSASLSYSPTNWLFASAGIWQNSSMLRDGIVKVYGFNRDETEMGFSLTARY